MLSICTSTQTMKSRLLPSDTSISGADDPPPQERWHPQWDRSRADSTDMPEHRYPASWL